jgi:PKD repeat protein
MKNHFSSLLVLLAVAACTPTPTNTAPVAQFMLPTGAVAGQAVVFSSNATDKDGDVLTQTWSFGDGGRGGGSTISHLFAAAGTYPITLTVSDGKDSNSFSANLQVAPDAPAGAPIAVQARVRDASGAPLAGVQARLNQTLLGTTDAAGIATVSIPTAKALSLNLIKTGYAEHFVPLEFPTGSTADNAYFEVVMLPRNAAQPFNATQGGVLSGKDGAQVQLPANALERADGTPVSGTVNIAMTPVDVTNPTEVLAFPGEFAGLEANGTRTGIVSLGTTEFALEQNGERLNLRPGMSATVRLPMYANSDLSGTVYTVGSTVPLWSLDERTGVWVQEGTGTVVNTPTGLALEAKVGHFSWWNADLNFTPSRPKPRCINDTPGQYDDIFAQAMFCKFLAELDRPIPTQNARNITPRLPSYAASTDLPIGGGIALDVPAGVNIRYTACIAGGQFCGTVVRSFAANTSQAFDIRLKRTDSEEITLPFDATRTFTSKKRFVFASSSSQNGVKITLERPAGSNFAGTVVLQDPSNTTLASGNASGYNLEQRLFAAGNYTLEITPSTAGSLRMRLERVNIADTGAWQTISELPDGETFETNPSFAINPDGHASVVWSRKQVTASTVYLVMAANFDATANTWSAPVLLEQQLNTRPEIAMNIGTNRDSMALWSQQTAQGVRVLRWARQPAGGAWSTPATLETAGVGRVISAPQVFVLPNGNAVATVFDEGGSSFGNSIRLAFYTANSNTWALSAVLPTGAFVGRPTLQLETDGTPWVFYPINSSAEVRRYSSNTWSVAQTVFTANSLLNAVSLRFVMNGAGQAIAALQQPDGTVRLRTSDGTTWKPEQVFAGNGLEFRLDSAGNATWVYPEFAGIASLLSRTYTASNDTWSAAQTLSSSTTGGVIAGLDFVQFALNSSGDAAVQFVKQIPNQLEQTSQLISRAGGGAWSAPSVETRFNIHRLGLDEAGRALRLRFGFIASSNKFVLQARRDSVR